MSAPDSELRAQVRLALPLAVGQLGQMLMGLVDTAVLGHYSAEALAGAGVGNSLFFCIGCVGMGVVMGLDTLVPQAFGAGEPARARTLLWQGLHLALLVSLPLLLVITLAALALPWFGVAPAVAEQGKVFLLARSPQTLSLLIFPALRSYLQAQHITRPVIIAMAVSNVANLALDWVLVFGDRGLADLGLPAIGLEPLGALGAAIATVVTSGLSVAMLAAAVASVRPPDGWDRSRARRRDPAILAAIARIGLPIGLQLGAEVGVFSLTTVLAAGLGETAAAGHQISLTLASVTFSMALGVGSAASIRVGHCVGAGDSHQARRAGFVALGLGVACMSMSALLFLLFPRSIASLFTRDAAVVAAAVPMLQIAALFQISDGAQAVAAGALRGAGDTRATFVANVVGHYGVGLGVSLLLCFGAGLGAPGLWWGLSAGLTVTALLLVARFARISSRPIARA
jgi:MATE family multidrug resistance protein